MVFSLICSKEASLQDFRHEASGSNIDALMAEYAIGYSFNSIAATGRPLAVPMQTYTPNCFKSFTLSTLQYPNSHIPP